MSWTALNNGLNVIQHQIVSGVNKPIYPFTRSANIEVAADVSSGTSLQSAQEAFQTLFARTQAATSSVAGIVKITDTLAEDASGEALVAASIGALKAVADDVDQLGQDYMKTSDYSFGSYDAEATQSLATLGTDGKVPAAQLPSYVDDVVEGYYKTADGKFYATYESETFSDEITPETGKIYVDLLTNKTYRWGGSAYAEISESLALGTTSSTAFPGDRGLALETWKTAMTTGTGNISKPENTNGIIQVNETTITVYTLTKSEIETVLGAATDSANGYMSATDHARFTEMAAAYEVKFYASGSSAPTFTGGNGIAIEVVSDDTVTP